MAWTIPEPWTSMQYQVGEEGEGYRCPYLHVFSETWEKQDCWGTQPECQRSVSPYKIRQLTPELGIELSLRLSKMSIILLICKEPQ